MHENREISCTSWSQDQDRSAKAINRTADVYVQEKSDSAVVPVSQSNKEAQATAEVGEGRAQIEENIVQCHMSPTQRGKRMSQGVRGVREAATERKQERFTALLHHLTIDLLRIVVDHPARAPTTRIGSKPNLRNRSGARHGPRQPISRFWRAVLALREKRLDTDPFVGNVCTRGRVRNKEDHNRPAQYVAWNQIKAPVVFHSGRSSIEFSMHLHWRVPRKAHAFSNRKCSIRQHGQTESLDIVFQSANDFVRVHSHTFDAVIGNISAFSFRRFLKRIDNPSYLDGYARM
jgi:hypothetical protein